jgi:hypothetical protein
MAAPRVGEQLVVQDPLEGPEQDSGQVAKNQILTPLLPYLVFPSAGPPVWSDFLWLVQGEALCGRYREVCSPVL